MTEDGRSRGTAATRGLSPSLFEVRGNRDAQLDAVANSLGLAGQANSLPTVRDTEDPSSQIRTLRGVSL
jgi:hypothetical protein